MPDGNNVLDFAKSLEGAPYRWRGPEGSVSDASGSVMTAFAHEARRGQAGYKPAPVDADNAARWAVIDALQGHRYDYANKGSKPNDPGWHVCSCGGWEGYWCVFESEHLSLEILRSVKRMGC